MSESHDSRRALVRHILRSRRVATQEELRRELASRGVDVTQATLSRDLAQLHARRVAGETGTVYELGEEGASTDDQLAHVRDMVVSVTDNGTLVVVHTITGAASAVAAVVDHTRLEAVLGTIAGDDTIFIAPARRTTAAALTKQLNSVWRKVQRT